MKHTTLILNGNRWKYKRPVKVMFKGKRVDGTFDFGTKTIRVDKSLGGKEEMETDVHEIDHVVHSELDEPVVERNAKQKTEAYWKLGYRKLTPEQLKILGFI